MNPFSRERRQLDDLMPNGARTTLGEAVRLWLTNPGVWLIIAAWTTALVARLWIGHWTWEDLLIAGIIVAFQPFTEWAIHTFVLHARPRRIFGRRYQSMLAREHVRHHRNPRELETIFVPFPWLAGLVTAPWLLLLVPGFDPPQVLTGLLTGYSLLLVYEWTHYLIHTPYRPRHAYYRYVRRAHVLHHFKNEHYWMGVTVHLADHVLRTFPDKTEVETSPTARTLGSPA